MKNETRAGIAYIALRLATGLSKSDVYDYSAGRYITIDGEVTLNRINVYDYSIGCHISGNENNGKYDLYHYGNNSSIELIKQASDKVTGYDYDVNNHFECKISGHSVTVYDYEKGLYFDYSF
ncbi:hypothetical protein [Bacillus sp. AK031]